METLPAVDKGFFSGRIVGEYLDWPADSPRVRYWLYEDDSTTGLDLGVLDADEVFDPAPVLEAWAEASDMTAWWLGRDTRWEFLIRPTWIEGWPPARTG
ncbi:MAG: hypothetical protein JJU45_15195 [Acidimicrobiia bacterium]|nr:hypothetical protein [Acidimicrobiia bacterium]